MEGGRSARPGHRPPGQGREGWESKLSAVPGGQGAAGTRRGRQPCPALSASSFALVSPPTARGGGEGCGRGRGARAARGRPRTPDLELSGARVGGPPPPPSLARPAPGLCCCSGSGLSTGAELALATFDGSCCLQAAGSLGTVSFPSYQGG